MKHTEENNFISSGILEMYCMGLTSEEENKEVKRRAKNDKYIRSEISSITEALLKYS